MRKSIFVGSMMAVAAMLVVASIPPPASAERLYERIVYDVGKSDTIANQMIALRDEIEVFQSLKTIAPAVTTTRRTVDSHRDTPPRRVVTTFVRKEVRGSAAWSSVRIT